MDETIRNQDIRRIRELPYMREMVEGLEQRREWVRARAEKITRQFSPMAGGGGGARRAMDETVAELEELDSRYALLLRTYIRKLARTERLIAGIESIQMREFVTMAYLEGRKGPDIQKRLEMSRWVYENCRKCIEEADSLAEVRWHDR